MRRYRKDVERMAKRYDMSQEEVSKMILMQEEINGERIFSRLSDENSIGPNLGIPTKFTRFANGEFKSELLFPVRGKTVFVIQDVTNNVYPINVSGSNEPINMSVNDHIMVLFSLVNALRISGAASIQLVLPTYPYARQHKKTSREGLMASVFGGICESLGVDRIITLDIHSREIEHRFTTMRLENLHASYQNIRHLSKIVDLSDDNLVVVSPDSGAISRNKFYASTLKKELAMLYKERDYTRSSTAADDTNITNMKLLGDVKGKVVFMADDMIGTGGTLISAMQRIMDNGATKIICAVSLPLFNGTAIEKFEEAYRKGYFYRIIGTNAVYHDENLTSREWYIESDTSDLFARVISRLHHDQPLSTLLDNIKIIQRLLPNSND